MARYAASTTVPAEQSRQEIERTLQRYGAESFMYGWEDGRAVVQFRAHERFIRFVLPLPDEKDEEFTTYLRGSTRYERTEAAAHKEWEQGVRQRWRALALCIKAKLEAVEAGIASFEDEFLAHTVLPDGTTFGAWARVELDEVYRTGDMPATLPALTAGS